MSLTNLQIGAWNVVGLSAESRGANGEVYFVEGNAGSDFNDGKSWDSAWQTLAKAIAVSHANIASGKFGWAKRNTIYICGDQFEESLIALPQKTDIVGCGSDSGFPMAGIKGHHAPVNGAMGVRFFNIHFRPVTANPLITLVSTSGSNEYHGCNLDSSGDAIATMAISATGNPFLKVMGCQIGGVGSGTSFATAAIYLGTGAARETVIAGNRIYSSAIGISVHASRSGGDSWIADNYIYAGTVTIDDDSDTFMVINNKLVTPAADGDTAVDINIRLAADNWVTNASQAGPWPDLDTT